MKGKCKARAGGVRASVETVVIPTYTIGKGLPSPSLFDLEETRGAYPKTTYDIGNRSAAPVDKEYKMAVIESDLLRVEVVPEVGGRVWRIIDKTSGRNLLYTNNVIKPVDVGRRRGWITTGIEFPFSVSNHGEDTMEPYRWRVRENADGSATITVMSFDHFYRFWGSYDMTIAPGEARMALTVRLYNPTLVRNRYQIWVNAAVDTGHDMQFVFPVDYIAGHGFSGIHPWPMWDDGKYDRSVWKNQKEQLGVFGWGADFLGVYYHDGDYGTIRYCPHTDAEGIKAWTWGVDSLWTKEYTDNQRPTAEIQWGRWPTQDMYGWLEPHEMDTWTEYWLPAKGLGGVDAASKDACMSVKVVTAGGRAVSAEVRVNVFRAVSGTLVAAARGRTLLSKPVSAGAGDVLAAAVTLPPLSGDDRLEVRLVEHGGAIVISYDKPIEKTAGPPPQMLESIRIKGNGPQWDSFREALSAELLEGNLSRAREEYAALVKAHPDFAPGWKSLGILLAKQLDTTAARDALSRAAKLDPKDDEARYYLALVQLELKEPAAAKTLKSLRGKGRFAALAKFVTGIAALRGGDFAAASKTLTEVATASGRDPVAWDYAAVAARLAGDADAASKAREAALAIEPLDPFAFVEELVAAGGATAESIPAALGANSDLCVETAFFYDAVDDHQTALAIAQAADAHAPSALYYYHLAYFASRAGRRAPARKYAAKGDEAGTDYVFPHRREDSAVLAEAESLAKTEGFAKYHRATLFYWLGRNDQALELWTGLLGRYDIPGLYRKVADAYARGKVTIALEAAIDMYRNALDDNPRDIEVFYALDDLYEKAGDLKNRRDLLSRARGLFPEDDALALRQARYFAWRTWHQQAAEVLTTHQFHRTHQSRQLMVIAQRAIEDTYTGLAMKALRAGDDAKALSCLAEASKAAETLKRWFD